jgi:hypothetical protein
MQKSQYLSPRAPDCQPRESLKVIKFAVFDSQIEVNLAFGGSPGISNEIRDTLRRREM